MHVCLCSVATVTVLELMCMCCCVAEHCVTQALRHDMGTRRQTLLQLQTWCADEVCVRLYINMYI
jgi:hypothetical protein